MTMDTLVQAGDTRKCVGDPTLVGSWKLEQTIQKTASTGNLSGEASAFTRR